MMEAWSKILEFCGKYAWAVFVTACFILFIPADAAEQIGITGFRNSYKGILWIFLVFTGVLSVNAAFHYLDRRVFDGWMKNRREQKKRATQEKQAQESLSLRLQSLDRSEQMWIKYCLFHNVQMLSAERTNATAQSLCHKGIVEEGSGHMMNLPFHTPDQVWRYLLEHKNEFLTEAEQKDRRFPEALEKFRKSLWPV